MLYSSYSRLFILYFHFEPLNMNWIISSNLFCILTTGMLSKRSELARRKSRIAVVSWWSSSWWSSWKGFILNHSWNIYIFFYFFHNFILLPELTRRHQSVEVSAEECLCQVWAEGHWLLRGSYHSWVHVKRPRGHLRCERARKGLIHSYINSFMVFSFIILLFYDVFYRCTNWCSRNGAH